MNERINNFLWKIHRQASMKRRKDGKYILTQEARFQAQLNKIFSVQMNWILKNIKDLPYEPEQKQDNAVKKKEVESILLQLPAQEAMVKALLEKAGFTMKKGGNRSVDEFKLGKLGISFSLKNPAAAKYLEEKGIYELSNFKGNITGTTKEHITKIIVDGINGGKSYSELAKQIKDQGKAGVFSRDRAQLIATRELGHAYEQGRAIPLNDFQEKYPDRKMQKEWQTVNDDRVTDECNENQDQGWIDRDDEFKSGDMEPPRDGNPRCRCTVSYRIV